MPAASDFSPEMRPVTPCSRRKSPRGGGFLVLGATGLGLDLEERRVVNLLLHLERRVLDPVAITEQKLHLAPGPVAVLSRCHDDVGRERLEPRRDRPHMELVHLPDAWNGAD